MAVVQATDSKVPAPISQVEQDLWLPSEVTSATVAGQRGVADDGLLSWPLAATPTTASSLPSDKSSDNFVARCPRRRVPDRPFTLLTEEGAGWGA